MPQEVDTKGSLKQSGVDGEIFTGQAGDGEEGLGLDVRTTGEPG